MSFGFPLPPGRLADAAMVRVLAADGDEIEASVRPLETWRDGGKEGTIRSVLVQFPRDFSKQRRQTVTIVLGQRRTKDGNRFVPVAETLLDKDGLKGPRVWATLPAKWLCDSGVAGPQVPAAESGDYAAYDRWVEVNFPGSLRYLNSTEFDHWLYDRPAGYYKMYVRTGDLKFLQAAYETAHFVRLHTVADGPLAGIFSVKEEIDLKYVYPRAMHLHYLLTGDERALEAGKLMAKLWLGGWEPGYEPGKRNASVGDSGWAARYEGYGLLAILHGWEMTGDRAYWNKARQYADAVYKHQTSPPDGRPADGSFRTSRQNEQGFRASSSPWMTSILLDGLFHYWTSTGDDRVGGMVTRWCDFLDRHGMVPDGSAAYYMIRSPVSDPGTGESDIGPDMELHNPEVAYMFAMGVYFSKDPERTAAYRKRFDQAFRLATALDHHNVLDHRALPGRETDMSVRSFNWSFQASSQIIYFLQHAGEKATTLAQPTPSGAGVP
ncbi:MAG: hypothetical protein EHM13_07260 [Acidobacteria bacterium]|nr:MAG: hypothetical protein EHM13_07260 [Acidobacteriota bacterium]